MTNCNTVTTPGIAHYKPTIGDEALLENEQHKRCRRIVGKLQWLAYTRPDIAYSTKLARDLTAPTALSQKRVKHLLRYLHQALQIHHRTNNNTQSKHQQHPGSRRSCRCRLGRMPTTRKSTSGFNIISLGTTVAFGSRTQATIALSSAESELYAIRTGVNEGLHQTSYLKPTCAAS